MINSIARLVLSYALSSTNANVQLDYSFQRSTPFFLSLVGVKVLTILRLCDMIHFWLFIIGYCASSSFFPVKCSLRSFFRLWSVIFC